MYLYIRVRDIPYMPGHWHISTYIYSHIQECRCAYIHTTDTYAGAYEYPLRLPASSEGDSQLKEWATRESGVKCNFDTRESLALYYREVTVKARESMQGHSILLDSICFSLRYEK